MALAGDRPGMGLIETSRITARVGPFGEDVRGAPSTMLHPSDSCGFANLRGNGSTQSAASLPAPELWGMPEPDSGMEIIALSGVGMKPGVAEI